jgi:ferredoxin
MAENAEIMEALRDHLAQKLKELDGVIGLRRAVEGTAPYLFRPGDDLSQLALEPRYPLGPIVSLLQKRYPQAHFGVVARGCDLRALAEMAKRNQVDPQRLYVFGVACTAEEAEECHCADPFPRLEKWPQGKTFGQPAPAGSPHPLLAEYPKIPLEERRAFWQKQFAKCIKCYGCRNICPECFCESCALEDPLWVEPGVLAPPFPSFHLIRAMHMATRCVLCRQCELTCPAHIPLTVLYELIRQDVKEMLGYEPGADLEAAPPLPLTLADAAIRE